jgi:hypothetical protein
MFVVGTCNFWGPVVVATKKKGKRKKKQKKKKKKSLVLFGRVFSRLSGRQGDVISDLKDDERV